MRARFTSPLFFTGGIPMCCTETALRDRILERLPAASRTLLTVYDSVTSTNDLLRQRAEAGAPEGTIVIARRQTAGRGRQGRAFYSPQDTGLYLSMLLRPAAEQVGQITPMAAAAAADAAEQCCGEPVQIKWVNDLLLHGKKISGILAESKFSASPEPDYVILGIGINLLTPVGGFPPELREIVGTVFPSGTHAEEAFVTCAALLIPALQREYALLSERHYLDGYKRRLSVLNRQITVSENGIDRPAVALAVDDDLRLLVRYADDGTEQWRATGEIRIRL